MTTLPLTSTNLKQIPTVMSMESRIDQLYRDVPPNGLQSRRKPRSRMSTGSSSSRHRRLQAQQYSDQDTARSSVLLSPRILPFPYHNDSHFLPVVEHQRQLQRAKSIASLRPSVDTMRCGASSILSSPTPSLTPRRRTSQSIPCPRPTSAPAVPPMPRPRKSMASRPWLQKIWLFFKRKPFFSFSMPTS
ncbi:hypothetical protein DM01DRAFT_362801 [Hesseltinella vesiculosa]|uniref:Uncharacterized protein n=1 Tax=Hesseltinella vesiculosa TaxID=101127 RepID=A0A1X2GP55_9FUNG|nr:hypothetical protein DM01DRAFT_362801 [Hesseltinella vesiculosa]